MKNKIILTLVIIFLLIVTGVSCYFIGYNNNLPKEDNNHQNEVSYKEYKIYEEIKLSDGSKWVVIKNSSKESDYVTLIKKDSDDITNPDTYNLLYNELFEIKPNYDNSELKKYVDSLANNIPVDLKEVDGYKIRLITIDEILELDNNWTYDEENDSYTNNNDDSKLALFVGLTMTNTKCSSGKCTPFYIVGANHQQNEDTSFTTSYYIGHWASGVPQIKPVINVYKSEIE